MSEVRFGIIGVGGMGTGHANRFIEGEVPDARLVAVCDVDPERLTGFSELACYTSADAMIAAGGIDAVLIATPHYDHVPLGIASLAAGLHVLVEKPIAVHKADAERLIAGYTRPDLVFAAMFNQRTDPRYLWVRDRIADGSLGKINRANWIITDWFRTASYYANGAWRATWEGEGGGVLLNQCPHQIDLWQWLFGMPDRVQAHCALGRFHHIEVEDDVTAFFEYDDGMTGVFITTTGETPGTNRLEIAAENGRVVIEGDSITFDRNAVPTSEFSRTTDKKFGRPDTETETITLDGSGEQHAGILRNFTQTILKKETLIAPAVEGIHSVELANAMLYSGLTGKMVPLPLDGAVFEAKLHQLIADSDLVKEVAAPTVASAEEMKASF